MKITLPPHSETNPVQVGNGVTCQWTADGQVLIIKLSNVTRTAIDVWIAAIETAVIEPFQQREVRILHDFGSLPSTQYSRHQAAELIKRHTGIKGKVGVVLRPSIFTPVIRVFVDKFARHHNPGVQYQIFTDTSIALKWLQKPDDIA